MEGRHEDILTFLGGRCKKRKYIHRQVSPWGNSFSHGVKYISRKRITTFMITIFLKLFQAEVVLGPSSSTKVKQLCLRLL